MELKDILKAAEDGGLDSAVISAIKGLDNTAEVERLKSELQAEQGKASGILEDKKKYKERAEKAEGDLKKIANDKLPEDEKHQKALEELKQQLESEKAEREKQAQEFAQTQREAKTSDLTSSVKWADGVPHDTAKLIIKNALAGVEDLSDASKVEEALKAVKESHKSLIAADAASGTGSKSSGEGSSNNDSKAPSIADNQKAIWGDK